nr:MAG TPA: hypothetical protein [Caudoviricetes sp.]
MHFAVSIINPKITSNKFIFLYFIFRSILSTLFRKINHVALHL